MAVYFEIMSVLLLVIRWPFFYEIMVMVGNKFLVV